MLIYTVLYRIPYEGDTLMGVFSSKENAQDFCDGSEYASGKTILDAEFIIVTSTLNQAIPDPFSH